MNIIERAISNVAGGRVLDVATQEGHFVQILMKNLQCYTQIIGIDVNEQAIKIARDTIGGGNIQFLVINAEHLDFEDESFDTVSISASFHHLSNIRQVLVEMERVLKSEGNFIIPEMHRDGQTEAELTSVYLHHWVADVDAALGGLHNYTLGRKELMNYVASLGLNQVESYDYTDRDSNPMEKTTSEQLDDLIMRVTQRAESSPSYESFELRRGCFEPGQVLLGRAHRRALELA